MIGIAKTANITIECLESQANDELNSIAKTIRERNNIVDASIIHFHGTFNLGKPLVHVFICGKHRKDAFEALEDAVDLYKKNAPLWKKESFSSGSTTWITHQ